MKTEESTIRKSAPAMVKLGPPAALNCDESITKEPMLSDVESTLPLIKTKFFRAVGLYCRYLPLVMFTRELPVAIRDALL